MAAEHKPTLTVVPTRKKRAVNPPNKRKPYLRLLEDPERRKALIEILRAGTPRVHACRAVGCSTDTLAGEIRRDPAFGEALLDAEAAAVADALATIRTAAINGQWQAAAWFLERRYPQEFARRWTVAEPEGDEPVIKVVVTRPGETASA